MLRERIRRLLRSPEVLERYRQREPSLEPVFELVNEVPRSSAFLLQGLEWV
ncbi:hypothetical protein MPNT_70089 [Candidatus Methylacidithermus pantelleriae]|uniref:Uncharacterized protein n=1 Tax=Candidatus Methylacidithermus pantelleriae TaxID=2744239 RepID=A0A8J2FXD3_9BACT|nr:hypothetical protein MPNT_170051 [Candidatus Methylacidithermus pantelleriae]CAF0704605.1 hypothetical protein MPNT_70089 [Candidatus Methylacidithermus pantelleriae]